MIDAPQEHDAEKIYTPQKNMTNIFNNDIQKPDATLTHQAENFLEALTRMGTLKNGTKQEIMDVMDISTGLKKILSILNFDSVLTDKKDIILKLSGLDDNTLKQMQKVRLRYPKPKTYYLEAIKNLYGSALDRYNMDTLLIAYRFYEKYKEFLATQQINKTTRGHTLKYNTSIQHIKHRIRMPHKKGTFGKGDYFFDSDEQFIRMNDNQDQKKEKEKSKLSINKYFGPMWIRIKETTDNTMKDIEAINGYNTDKNKIEIHAGDYIVELDISPHEFKGGKPLQEAYRQLAHYLNNDVYSEIIADSKKKGINISREDIHIPFVFGITALTTFAKRGGRDIRRIPLHLAKRTSTYMYGLFNPHGKYTEQPALLKFTDPLSYRQLEKMSDKYNARDISFVSIDFDTFISQNS